MARRRLTGDSSGAAVMVPVRRRFPARYGIGSIAAAALFAVLMKPVIVGPLPDPPKYRIPPMTVVSVPQQRVKPAPTQLERVYASADLDHNGLLSWHELKAFQVIQIA